MPNLCGSVSDRASSLAPSVEEEASAHTSTPTRPVTVAVDEWEYGLRSTQSATVAVAEWESVLRCIRISVRIFALIALASRGR